MIAVPTARRAPNCPRIAELSSSRGEPAIARYLDANSSPGDFQVMGVIKDVDRLKSLFDLFAAVLDQLCRIGSAYKQETGVEL